MQEIFLCSTCGAQNVVGQEYCQHCGQRFQYNCPYCGAVVNSTLINCPGCRERLYWPTPRRIKPFPKEAAGYPPRREHEPATGRGAGEAGGKKQQKSDPWLTGCLGIVIIAIIIMVAFFLYDWLSRPSVPEEPVPSGAVRELIVLKFQSGFSPSLISKP